VVAKSGLPDNVRYRKVQKCSACKRTHYIIFSRLVQPEVIGGVAFPFAGTCPRTGLTVYLREEEESHAVEN
jgi:hypothetical protein